MYLPYQSVHTPLQVPEEYLDLYPDTMNESRRYFAGMFMKILVWCSYTWTMLSVCFFCSNE